MSRTIATIWGGLLAVSVFAVVPAVLILLNRALQAAQQIERFTADILANGANVARSTEDVRALQATIAAAPTLVERATAIEQHLATIGRAVGAIPEGNGHGPEWEVEL